MPRCQISPLASDTQAQACAALMAVSEPWLTLGYGYTSLLRTMRTAGRECYLAHNEGGEGGLAGFILLNLHGTFVGYIQTLCIAPDFRGQGCGSQLVAFAEQRIFRDHPNVFLCVSSFNHSARKLYERLGYTQVGEIKDFLVAGHSEVLLRKTRGPLSTFQRPVQGLAPCGPPAPPLDPLVLG